MRSRSIRCASASAEIVALLCCCCRARVRIRPAAEQQDDGPQARDRGSAPRRTASVALWSHVFTLVVERDDLPFHRFDQPGHSHECPSEKEKGCRGSARPHRCGASNTGSLSPWQPCCYVGEVKANSPIYRRDQRRYTPNLRSISRHPPPPGTLPGPAFSGAFGGSSFFVYSIVCRFSSKPSRCSDCRSVESSPRALSNSSCAAWARSWASSMRCARI
jgi:hypothetical protein